MLQDTIGTEAADDRKDEYIEYIHKKEQMEREEGQDHQLDVDETNAISVESVKERLEILLRFTQLLCENHNPDLQNHLRVQYNSDEVIFGKNFNVIELVA